MIVKTLEDINQFIDARIEEGLTLEYKRQVSSNKEIAKDISAFANTDGGTIVYGVLDRDKTPTSIVWVTSTGVEEQIQNVVATAIHPIVEDIKILRLPNPQNNSEAIYVIKVPKSLEAPHMANNRYYRRHGSESVPMEDIEVKNAIFGSGRTAALHFEISQNLELISRTQKLIDQVYVLSPEKRQAIALIPFHTDAWNSMVASGLLSSLQPEVAERLVEAYRLIHEINTLIEWLKIAEPPIVHTPAEPSSVRHGKYLPAIIKDKLPHLSTLLEKIATFCK